MPTLTVKIEIGIDNYITHRVNLRRAPHVVTRLDTMDEHKRTGQFKNNDNVWCYHMGWVIHNSDGMPVAVVGRLVPVNHSDSQRIDVQVGSAYAHGTREGDESVKFRIGQLLEDYPNSSLDSIAMTIVDECRLVCSSFLGFIFWESQHGHVSLNGPNMVDLPVFSDNCVGAITSRRARMISCSAPEAHAAIFGKAFMEAAKPHIDEINRRVEERVRLVVKEHYPALFAKRAKEEEEKELLRAIYAKKRKSKQ